MTQSSPDPLGALSSQLTGTVAQTARHVVAVTGRRRLTSSGFVWRPGVVVTAEEALEEDQDMTVLLANGQRVAATLAGRDPSTDIAVLRIEDTSIPALSSTASNDLLPGQLTVAVGRRAEGVIANLGIVSVAGGPWRSQRGGQIDKFIRLDLRLDGRAEGGVVADTQGRAIGMAVLGPRRSVLAIPAATIERVADQLLSHGRIARGYLGLGLRPVRLDAAVATALAIAEPHGAIVISVDPQGPGQRAGVLLGDVVTSWNGEPVRGVRDILRRLGPEAVGHTVDLALIRAGKTASATVTIGERPAT